MYNLKDWNKQSNIIGDILSKAPDFDKSIRIGKEEFELGRKRKLKKINAGGIL